jgi:hypothetical protein
MQNSPAEPPDGLWDENRMKLLLLKILRIFLTVVYLSIGAVLVLLSFLIWKNNELMTAVLGSVLFLFGGASFIALGIDAIGRLRRRL